MRAKSPIFFLLLILITIGSYIIAGDQEKRSLLLDSCEQYLKLNQNSKFNLEWISLGPVMNSARVEAVQCDPANPGTMYVAFGSGNLWKTTNHALTW